MENRYKGLQVLAVVFSVVSWGVLIVGVVAGVSVLTGASHAAPRPMGFMILAVSGLYFCLFGALSGMIGVLLAIEEHTRRPS